MSQPPLFDEIRNLATEQRNPESVDIDRATTREILEIINTEDHLVPIAVRREIPYIEQAVEIVLEAFRNGGRLIYVGAGTSGRVGVQDAAECTPTFGTPPEMVVGLIAGGKDAMFLAQEGAEDFEESGVEDLKAIDVNEKDVVCGIAASRRTPYVVGAVEYARSVGAKTLFVTMNPRSEFNLDVDVAICPVVGPEVVMGSTRMKSGTSQKLVLNMITTTAMVRMGKTYENMMVDLKMTNKKLVERARRIIMTITGVDYSEAARFLDAADGHVKTALVMILADVNVSEAKSRLDKANGFVRDAIAR